MPRIIVELDPAYIDLAIMRQVFTGQQALLEGTGQSFAKAKVERIGDGQLPEIAAIFWAKTRMGWKEAVVNEHGGIADNPVKISVIRRIIVSPPDRDKLRATPGLAISDPELCRDRQIEGNSWRD